jgi:hypothetical protein
MGFIYFVFLLPSLFIALAKKNYKILFLAAIAFFLLLFTFQGTAYLRYILPFFIIANTIIGASYNLYDYGYLSKKIFCFILTCLILFNLIYFKAAVNFSHPLNFEALLSEEGKRSYLIRALPITTAFEIVNSLNDERKPVLIFGSEAASGLNADAVYVSWYNPKIVEMLTNANDLNETFASLKYFQVKYVIIDFSVLPAIAEPLKIRALLEKSSDEIVRVGSVSIRKNKE